MKKKVDILISDGFSTDIAKTIMKDFHKKGISCFCVDDSGIPSDEFAFIRLIKKILEDIEPRVIIPLFRGETLSRFRKELPEGIILAVEDAQKMHVLDDKVLCSELCASIGILQPRLYKDDQIGLISKWPVVFKRNTGLGGAGVYFPKAPKALSNLVKSSSGKPHLVMDYIQGYDICVDTIRYDGYFHAECYKVILPKRKGISIVRKSVFCPEIVSSVKKILDSLDYRGVCEADFRVDPSTGLVYFLECNPRFSGGLRSQIRSGFDQPWIFYRLTIGETPSEVKFKKGVITIDWKPLLGYIQSRLRHMIKECRRLMGLVKK